MSDPIDRYLLTEILKGVSRSFYLTLRVVPGRVREPLGLGYLFCRAADTIADTDLLPPAERLKYLNLFREQFKKEAFSPEAVAELRDRLVPSQGNPAERVLLSRLEDCFRIFETLTPEDRERMRDLVGTLTNGMEMDLTVFPPERSGKVKALSAEQDLDRYCYYVAGVVGEYWTRMIMAHFPSLRDWEAGRMRALGMRFGKGLQMTNILKDLGRDLSRGRCYIPKTLLDAHGLRAEDLTPKLEPDRLKALLAPLIKTTLDHLEEGWAYIMAIPRREIRLRLACLWPHLFAVRTLSEIQAAPRLLDPQASVKISRAAVYSTLLLTTAISYSNTFLTRYLSVIK